MAGDAEESALDEKPSEFFTAASAGGHHDGQAIVPEGDHYRCWCSCGEWQIEAPTEAAGSAPGPGAHRQRARLMTHPRLSSEGGAR